MRRIAVVAVLAVLLVSPGIIFAFQDEPEGFRGLKWGDPPGEDMIYVSTHDDIIWHKRKNDELQIGKAKLHTLRYGFYKNQFMKVAITTKEKEDSLKQDYDFLKEIVELKFGYGKQRKDELGYFYEWPGEVTTIILHKNLPGIGVLIIRSTKIYKQTLEGLDDF